MGALMKWCATPWERGAPAPRNCILFFTTKDTKGAINYELRITNYECRG